MRSGRRGKRGWGMRLNREWVRGEGRKVVKYGREEMEGMVAKLKKEIWGKAGSGRSADTDCTIIRDVQVLRWHDQPKGKKVDGRTLKVASQRRVVEQPRKGAGGSGGGRKTGRSG